MEDSNISKEAWLTEPFTLRMAHTLADIKARRLEALLVACRKSQDPLVVAAFGRYEASIFMKELFDKGEFRDG